MIVNISKYSYLGTLGLGCRLGMLGIWRKIGSGGKVGVMRGGGKVEWEEAQYSGLSGTAPL